MSEEKAPDAAKAAEQAAGKEAAEKAAKATAEKETAAKAAKEAADKEAAAKAAAEKEAAAKAAGAKEAAEKDAADQAQRAAAEEAAKQAEAKRKAAPAGAPRGKLLLVAWSGSRASEWEGALAHAGYDVYVERSQRLAAFQWANEHGPVAAVIDLSANPDDGRRLATTLRITSATARIPLVFCDAAGSGAAPLATVDAVIGALAKL